MKKHPLRILNNQIITPISFNKLNIRTDILKPTYIKMNKAKKIIDQSQYVLSYLENLGDKKKCQNIKKEMLMQKENYLSKFKTESSSLKSHFYIQNLNITNYKKFLNRRQHIEEENLENEMMLEILTKFNLKHEKKQIQKEKIKYTKTEPFDFESKNIFDINNRSTNFNTTSIFSYMKNSSHLSNNYNYNSKACLYKNKNLPKFQLKNYNFNINCLNRTQYKIIKNCNETQSDYMKNSRFIKTHFKGYTTNLKEIRCNNRNKNIFLLNKSTPNKFDVFNKKNISIEAFKNEYKKIFYKNNLINQKIFGNDVDKKSYVDPKEILYNYYAFKIEQQRIINKETKRKKEEGENKEKEKLKENKML